MTTDEPKWEPWMERMLNEIKEKFINDRVNGFNHPVSGEWFDPAPRTEVEARWKKQEPKFRQELLTDPEWREMAQRKSAGEEWKSDEPVSSDQPQKTVSPVPVEQQSTKIMLGAASLARRIAPTCTAAISVRERIAGPKPTLVAY
jgi:hypothetical protein